MGKIPVDKLIALFRRMYDEHWRYTLGHAVEGDVDCSGAFVWAYRQFGKTIAHGSNAIARKYVDGLLPISEVKPGMAAFKYYPPGHPKWNLPAKYRKGGAAYNGDLNDYYHVGLVDSSGKYVLNAQGTKAGFTRTKLSTWGCVGYLKAVEYNLSAAAAASPLSGETGKKGSEKPMQMIVTAESGTTVKMRSRPDKSGVVVSNVLVGTTVEAEYTGDEWTPITADGRKGYMMSKFLVPASEGADAPAAEGYARTLTTNELETLRERVSTMESALEVIKRILWGVG